MYLINIKSEYEYFRIKPLLCSLKENNIKYYLYYISDNYDIIEDDINYIKETFYFTPLFDIAKNTDDNLYLNVADAIGARIDDNNIKGVIVYSDSLIDLAVSQTALNRNVPIVLLNSGRRTYDFDDKSDLIRQQIARIANLHLCSTSNCVANLHSEGIRKPKYITGSIYLDSINTTKLDTEPSIFIHPKYHHSLDWVEDEIRYLTNFKRIYNKNLSYNEYIDQIKKSEIIISDDEIIQEETCYLKKKLIIFKRKTDRPECLWLNGTKCINKDYMATAFKKLIDKKIEYDCVPYGNGNSGKKIVEHLKKE